MVNHEVVIKEKIEENYKEGKKIYRKIEEEYRRYLPIFIMEYFKDQVLWGMDSYFPKESNGILEFSLAHEGYGDDLKLVIKFAIADTETLKKVFKEYNKQGVD